MRVSHDRNQQRSAQMWKQKLIVLTLLCCVVLIATMLIGLVIASSLGPMWHLFHSGSITFQEWIIPVPERFFLRQEGAVPVLWKLGFGVPIWDAPRGQIRLYNWEGGLRFQFDSHYGRFVNQASADAADRGFRFLAEKRIVVDNTPGYCLEFVSKSKNSRIDVICTIEESGVSVWYVGDSLFVDDFWGVLQGMSLTQEQR